MNTTAEPTNQYSTRHSHEPEVAPVFDEPGRCLICVELVLKESLEAAKLKADDERIRAEVANIARRAVERDLETAVRERDEAREELRVMSSKFSGCHDDQCKEMHYPVYGSWDVHREATEVPGYKHPQRLKKHDGEKS